jgi:hypothetical protein
LTIDGDWKLVGATVAVNVSFGFMMVELLRDITPDCGLAEGMQQVLRTTTVRFIAVEKISAFCDGADPTLIRPYGAECIL